MRSQGGRTVKMSVAEEAQRGPDISDRGRVEALFDQNLFRLHIQRERSSAFWFAASIWGVSGLLIGACLGAYMMFAAYTGMSPMVRENLIAGAAMDEARTTVNNRDSLVHEEMNGGSDTTP